MSVTKKEQEVLEEAFHTLQVAAEKWTALAGVLGGGVNTGRLYLSNGWVIDIHPSTSNSAEVDLGEVFLTGYADKTHCITADPTRRNVEVNFSVPSWGVDRLSFIAPEPSKESPLLPFLREVITKSVSEKEPIYLGVKLVRLLERKKPCPTAR